MIKLFQDDLSEDVSFEKDDMKDIYRNAYKSLTANISVLELQV